MEEKIYRKKDKIIVEIPYYSKRSNAYMPDEDIGEYPTLTGLIIRHTKDDDYDEIGFAKTIDMDYKDKPDQVDGFVIIWYGGEEDFIKKCDELDLNIHEINL